MTLAEPKCPEPPLQYLSVQVESYPATRTRSAAGSALAFHKAAKEGTRKTSAGQKQPTTEVRIACIHFIGGKKQLNSA